MRERKGRRPSPATVLAIVALIAALAGTADAARRIGAKQLRNNAVTTKKIKKNAVTTAKLADRAVTGRKLANGAVSGGKLANGAVTGAKVADASLTGEKLTPGERSEGYVVNNAGQTALTGATDNTVASLSLPAGGAYVVTAAVALGNNGAVQNLVSCTLRDDGTAVSTGSADLAQLPVFSQTITLTGTSDGGVLTLICQPDVGAQARSRVITAIRVGSLH